MTFPGIHGRLSIMTNPRSALDRLVRAFEVFLNAAQSSPDPDADAVIDASDELVDAYTIFDDAVFRAYGAELPFDVYDDEDVDDDADEDDEDDFDDFDDDDEDGDFEQSALFDDDDLEPLDGDDEDDSDDE